MQDLKFVPQRDWSQRLISFLFDQQSHSQTHTHPHKLKNTYWHTNATLHPPFLILSLLLFLSLSLRVLLFRRSSFHRLINRIQQATNTEKRGVWSGGPTGQTIRTSRIKQRRTNRDAHKHRSSPIFPGQAVTSGSCLRHSPPNGA